MRGARAHVHQGVCHLQRVQLGLGEPARVQCVIGGLSATRLPLKENSDKNEMWIAWRGGAGFAVKHIQGIKDVQGLTLYPSFFAQFAMRGGMDGFTGTDFAARECPASSIGPVGAAYQ